MPGLVPGIHRPLTERQPLLNSRVFPQPARFCQADREGSRMPETETFAFRASLKPKIYRDFEISSAGSLYTLAQAIVRFFDFDFDHAFGFL